MDWRGRRTSSNVEDLRSVPAARGPYGLRFSSRVPVPPTQFTPTEEEIIRSILSDPTTWGYEMRDANDEYIDEDFLDALAK